MSDKLKIYACSGIGDTPEDRKKPIGYYTDGTNTLESTQAVNTLLAKINTCRIEAQRLQTLTAAERKDALDEMDVYSVGLVAARQYAKDSVKLGRAGLAIGSMISAGDFAYDTFVHGERQDHLDHLIEKMHELVNGDEQLQGDPEFTQWWTANVIERNKVGTDFAQRMAIHKAIKARKLQPKQKGAGAVDESWQDDEELSKYLCDGGTYFLYLFFTDKQLAKLPEGNRRIFKAKARGQQDTYDYCKATFVGIYGSEEEMVDIIRAGIIDRFGDTPEQVCQDIADGKRNAEEGVGIATEIIVALITLISGLLIALIEKVCDAIAKKNQAKYEALNQRVIEESCPNQDDFEGLDVPKTQTAGISSGAMIAAGAALLALLFIKK